MRSPCQANARQTLARQTTTIDEYRDGVTAYGAFTYFITKTFFDLGHERAGTRSKRKFTFEDLLISVAEVMKPYHNQQPQLVGPKGWLKTEVPWYTRRRARAPRRPRMR